MAVIFITTGRDERRKYRLPDTKETVVTIGRNADCMIALPDVVGVSGLHCSITYDGEQYTIHDEKSTNGTLCNGESVKSQVLYRGDVYKIGQATLVFDPEAQKAPSVSQIMETMADEAETQETPESTEQSVTQAAAAAPHIAETEASESGEHRAGKPSSVPTDPESSEQRGERHQSATGRKAESQKPKRRSARTRQGGGFRTLLVALYVLLMLAGAVYAGLVLRHWQETGTFLPSSGAQPR